jgi:hypothetical protein
MQDHPLEAVQHYEAGTSELQGHPCPMVEWKILHALLKHAEDSEQYRIAAGRCLHYLADSIRDPADAARFRRSKAVRELGR